MPTLGCGDNQNLSRHYRYFEAICMAKGASKRKAERWAFYQVYTRGRRAPGRAEGGEE